MVFSRCLFNAALNLSTCFLKIGLRRSFKVTCCMIELATGIPDTGMSQYIMAALTGVSKKGA